MNTSSGPLRCCSSGVSRKLSRRSSATWISHRKRRIGNGSKSRCATSRSGWHRVIKAMRRVCFIVIATVVIAIAAETPAEKAALDRISADSLRANLSFIASDELEGRNTPSPGLDRAADYIADRFRRAGLEPAAAGHSYFQVAKFDQSTPDLTGFQLLLKSGDQRIDVPVNEARPRSLIALDFM